MSLSHRLPILLEVVGFVAFALVSKALLSLVLWKYAGPITLIATLVILTIYMHRRGLSWRAFGLKALPGARAKLLVIPQALLTLLAFAVAVGSIIVVGEYFEIAFLQDRPAGIEARFGAVRGNLSHYLLWLALTWISAAFGEEMFFRGYLVGRLTTTLSGIRFGPALAVVVSAVIFGYGHVYYQGLRGFVMTGVVAVVFGASYLLLKRNLWPAILVHGLIDSLLFTATYLGLED